MFRQDGLELKGEAGNYISGMKEKGYQISVLEIGKRLYILCFFVIIKIN